MLMAKEASRNLASDQSKAWIDPVQPSALRRQGLSKLPSNQNASTKNQTPHPILLTLKALLRPIPTSHEIPRISPALDGHPGDLFQPVAPVHGGEVLFGVPVAGQGREEDEDFCVHNFRELEVLNYGDTAR